MTDIGLPGTSSALRIFPHYVRRNLYRNTKRQGIIVLCDDLG